MSADRGDDDLDELLARGRSSRFDAALTELLRAYHFDLQSLQLEHQAKVSAASSSHRFEGADTCLSRDMLSEGTPLPPAEHRTGTFKLADSPVDELPAVVMEEALAADDWCRCRTPPGLPPTPIVSGGDGADEYAHDLTTSMASSLARRRSFNNFLSGGSQDSVTQMGRFEVFVRSPWFEAMSALLLLVFCVLTAFETQRDGLYLGHELGWPSYREPSDTGWPEAGQALAILIGVCSIFFALEFIVRCAGSGRAFLCDAWNYLDLAILTTMAIEVAGAELTLSMGFMRPLRLLRLLRFVRLLKFIHRLESLYFLMQALSSSWRIMIWCCLVLMAVQTMTAFFISQLLFAFYFSDVGNPLEDRLEVFEYYGSFSRSILTTFEMAMGNWPVPARVLFENVSEWFLILFLVHKMTVGFSVVGIINAVFMQETLQLATFDDGAMVMRKRRHAKLIGNKLDRLFCAADSSKDGKVDRDEFRAILEEPDVRMWLASMDFDCQDPDGLFDLLDKDRSNEVTADEFYNGMTTLRGPARSMDVLRIGQELHVLQRRLGFD